MEPYQNLNENSGVHSYEAAEDSISVQFNDGEVWVFTNDSAGSANIEHMKTLASRGTGLHSFINNNVHNRYAYKLDD